jgi:hypothetical protein
MTGQRRGPAQPDRPTGPRLARPQSRQGGHRFSGLGLERDVDLDFLGGCRIASAVTATSAATAGTSSTLNPAARSRARAR